MPEVHDMTDQIVFAVSVSLSLTGDRVSGSLILTVRTVKHTYTAKKKKEKGRTETRRILVALYRP